MNSIPHTEVSQYLSVDIAWQYKAIPHAINGNELIVLADTAIFNEKLIGELELITGYTIRTKHESVDSVEQMFSKLYRKNEKATTVSISNTNNDDFLLKIIQEAKDLKSSDIHIEPFAEKCRIRLRIDGKLVERYSVPKDEYTSFINKIKIRAKLDIAEKRLPQDGRILINEKGSKMDIRVSVLPTLHGEKAVLRLLNTDAEHISVDKLGLDELQLSTFLKVLKKLHGLILISGPTGSGKTTTLYATLKILNNEYSNILTIEDPIEYTLEGVNQVQLKENIGLTFSNALRTFLRQNPDIIMLGEIRDNETAQMAIRAALTGHLVLSTIHTNSAWGTVSRLVDMGVPTFLLANTLNMTIAQRLIRKLCSTCKKKLQVDVGKYPEFIEFPMDEHSIPIGCSECYFTGYSGRIAIYEIIPIDYELSQCIKDNKNDVEKQLKERKIIHLRDRALYLVKNGETSIEEAYPILINF